MKKVMASIWKPGRGTRHKVDGVIINEYWLHMQNMRKNRAAQNYMGNNAYLKLYNILVLKFFKRAFGI